MPEKNGNQPERKRQITISYVVLAGFALLLFQGLAAHFFATAEIPYSQFETLLKDGKIADLTASDTKISGTLKEPLPDGRKQFITTRVDPNLARDLEGKGVTYSGEVPGYLSQFLSWILPIGLFYLIWIFVIRRMADRQGLGGAMAIGK